MFDPTTRARELCARLDYHTNSLRNVELIAEALQQARVFGRNEIYDAPKSEPNLEASNVHKN